MNDDLVVKQGAVVWIGGDVQASGKVIAIVEGRRVEASGALQPGIVRVKLDTSGDEIEVSATEIERVL